MMLREILEAKGASVHSITPDATLGDVVKKLVDCNCGSLVVCQVGDAQKMVGIITERDILRASVDGSLPLDQQTVGERMTRDVVFAAPGQSVANTMGQMTDRRIRHMPVLENDRLVGIISIGDVVKAQHDALTMENHYLKNYIHS